MANIIRSKKGAPQGRDLGLDHHAGPGKGSRPRNCWSREFRTNFDRIFKKRKL